MSNSLRISVLSIVFFCTPHICLAVFDSECPSTGSVTLPTEDCSRYLVCDNGVGVIQECPGGLYYNPEIMQCDWDYNVPECVGGTRPPQGTNTQAPTTTTPKPTTTELQTTPPETTTTALPSTTTPEPTTTELPTTVPTTVTSTPTPTPTTTVPTLAPTTAPTTTVASSTPEVPTTTTEVISTSPSNGNACPPTGVDKLPSPDSCSSYILCANGEAYEEECADGLLFNPEIKECDFPEHVNCTVTQITTIPTADTTSLPFPECPSEGVVKIPYPGDCSLYIICVEGFGVVQNCVSGTCFDPVDLQCKPNNTNDQQPVPNVPQDNAELCLGTAKVSVFVPRIGTCDKFLYCIDNKFQGSYTCANHYHFSFNLQRCIHIGESSCNISKNN